MRILMSVETKRSSLPEIRIFKSTGEALDYMIKRKIRFKSVTVETIKDGRVVTENNTLSSDSMGYLF